MKINTAYIISYLPSKNNLREKRLEIHKKQLSYWFSKGYNIVVYAQGYEKDDFQKGVNYIINETNEIKRPGAAKNILLKEFYKTDQDFCVLLDDDIIFYEGEKYCDSDNILEILKKIPIEYFDGIDVFEPLNPTQSPFSQFFKENKDLLSSFLYFKIKPHISGACLFVRNFPKFGAKEFYFDDWYDEKTGKIVMGEDVGFGLKLIKNKRGVYTLYNVVRKDMGWTFSTWCENDEERKKSFDKLKQIVLDLGIELKGNKLDWIGFAKKYEIPKKILVPKTSKFILDIV